jgi:hypothetical protein
MTLLLILILSSPCIFFTFAFTVTYILIKHKCWFKALPSNTWNHVMWTICDKKHNIIGGIFYHEVRDFNFEVLVNFYHTTQSHIPDDSDLDSHCCEILKFHIMEDILFIFGVWWRVTWNWHHTLNFLTLRLIRFQCLCWRRYWIQYS